MELMINWQTTNWIKFRNLSKSLKVVGFILGSKKWTDIGRGFLPDSNTTRNGKDISEQIERRYHFNNSCYFSKSIKSKWKTFKILFFAPYCLAAVRKPNVDIRNVSIIPGLKRTVKIFRLIRQLCYRREIRILRQIWRLQKTNCFNFPNIITKSI